MENKILQAKIKDLEMEIAILKNSGNWLKRTPSRRQQISEQVVEWIKQHYEEMNGTLGYRQMTITINREHEVHYNKKRIYRLMQLLHLKSVTRVKKKKYIPSMRRIFFFLR
ncbi:MAG: IS3 family transposase [Oscillospiraceae bacterium]|nr:IS3 family transposase [Oscillospiraceae bacterium]